MRKPKLKTIQLKNDSSCVAVFDGLFYQATKFVIDTKYELATKLLAKQHYGELIQLYNQQYENTFSEIKFE